MDRGLGREVNQNQPTADVKMRGLVRGGGKTDRERLLTPPLGYNNTRPVYAALLLHVSYTFGHL